MFSEWTVRSIWTVAFVLLGGVLGCLFLVYYEQLMNAHRLKRIMKHLGIEVI